MKISDYEKYLKNQERVARRTYGRTIRSHRRREWFCIRMKELGIEGKSILCVGARHDSEILFFEEKGFDVDGIDLYATEKIIKCDMSKMLEHPYLKTKKYDIVFSIESIEHCIDLDGFINGLNSICSKYFICFCPSAYHLGVIKEQLNARSWDAAIHQFMIDKDKLEENLLNTFKQFKIIVSEFHRKQRMFFILEKK